MSSQEPVLELSHIISENCSGKTHDQIMLALMNVIVNIVNHADSGEFTSQTVRYMTDVQQRIVNVRGSDAAFSPKQYLIN